MSVSSIGGGASSLWQLLRQSRTERSDPGSATQATSADKGVSGSDATASPGSTSGLGDAAHKIISELNSLLLGLQSDGDTTGTSTASTTGTASATGDTATSQISGQAQDPQTLPGDTKKTGAGHHHHHHGGGGAEASGTQQANPLRNLAGVLAYANRALGAAAQGATASLSA